MLYKTLQLEHLQNLSGAYIQRNYSIISITYTASLVYSWENPSSEVSKSFSYEAEKSTKLFFMRRLTQRRTQRSSQRPNQGGQKGANLSQGSAQPVQRGQKRVNQPGMHQPGPSLNLEFSKVFLVHEEELTRQVTRY